MTERGETERERDLIKLIHSTGSERAGKWGREPLLCTPQCFLLSFFVLFFLFVCVCVCVGVFFVCVLSFRLERRATIWKIAGKLDLANCTTKFKFKLCVCVCVWVCVCVVCRLISQIKVLC
jgi:hypothetical protein